MLNIITGRTGSGKTRYIRNLATEIAKNESNSVVMMVPEQFSFDTERALLELLGNEKYNNIENTSFSRLANNLLRDYGKLNKPIADEATRAVLMSIALDSLQDKITIYKKHKKNPALISELLDFNRELKKCRISVDELKNVSTSLSKPTFRRKIDELSVVFELYETLLNKQFQDDSVMLDMLADLLCEVHYFKDKTVFVDAFSGFSAQEYKVLERILVDARDVYVTFCCDTSRNNNEYELFYNAKAEIQKLKVIANRVSVKIAPEKVLYPNKKYKAEALNVLEDSLFDVVNESYKCDCDCVKVVPCKTKLEECDYVASEIKRLTREENYRYRDIAVIERTNGDYKNQLMSSFRKYGIDCFHDNRQPILTQPLMAFMLSLFDILGEGFQNEMVLRFLKTGLFGFSIEDIALVEEYILMWNIRPGEWRNEWVNNPYGFGVEFTEESMDKLNKLNDLREKIVGPLLALKKKLLDTTGETISRELFMFLRNAKVNENLKEFTNLLLKNGETDLALEQGRIWKILTDILDNLYSAIGDTNITLQRYRELFEIIVSTKDLGQIPNGIDEVIIGSADRIRATAPKAVFIVGANTGVFPKVGDCGVVFSDSERCELQEKGIELVSNLEYNSISERFIAYHAMTLATDKLYVSYSALNNEATAITPSELVSELERIFENVNIVNISEFDLIESKKSAFSILAKENVKGSVLGATLYEFFENQDSKIELAMIDKTQKKSFEIKDKALATELFGKNMYLSASKAERYYSCPFGYFCEHGIKAKPRREAEMDPAQTGTLVHDTLEIFLKENPKDVFVKLSENEIKEKISIIVDDYVETKLSGYENKPSDFLRSISLIKENIYKVILQLVDEFSQSEFVPVDFELSINNDGEIDPYLINLDNGGTVKIIGKVDRVDAYYDNDETYIRIVDYKTGGKDFKLYEVFAGINMQMLIYLFAIWQNGAEKYGNVVPSGILYFQAKNKRVTSSTLSRYSDKKSIEKEIHKNFKMSGMVLNNSKVITAMEKDGAGVFIPAKFDSKGNISGNVISVFALQELKNRVDNLISEMACGLQNGNIIAKPVEEGCKYCKYNDVCRREEQDPINEIEELNFKDAIDALGGNTDGNKVD